MTKQYDKTKRKKIGKKAAAILCITLTALCFSACKSREQGEHVLKNGEQQVASVEAGQSKGVGTERSDKESSDKEKDDNNNGSQVYDDLIMLNSNRENYCNTGYYFLEEGEHQRIKYIDYETRQEIYLCNKPNCKHDNEDCSAYIDSISVEMYVYGGSIYLVSSSGDTTVMSVDAQENISMDTVKEAPVIYRMNLDGTGKEKIFELPAGMDISPQLISGEYLFAFFSKSESVELGPTSHASVEKEKYLSVINLKTGKWEKLMDGKNKNIVGVYKGSFIITQTLYPKDPNEFLDDDDGWLENMKNSDISLTLYSLESKREEKIAKLGYDKMQEIICDGKFVYFLRDNSSAIDCLDLETKKIRTVKELKREGASLRDCGEGKLLYLYYDKESDEALVKDAYIVNVSTGEEKEFTLLDENRICMERIGQNDDYYLVILGYKMSDYYKTWAGTMQRNIEEIRYGLITKENYWSSTADYIEIKGV